MPGIAMYEFLLLLAARLRGNDIVFVVTPEEGWPTK